MKAKLPLIAAVALTVAFVGAGCSQTKELSNSASGTLPTAGNKATATSPVVKNQEAIRIEKIKNAPTVKYEISKNGITPAEIKIKKGEPIKLEFVAKDADYDVEVKDLYIKANVKTARKNVFDLVSDRKAEFKITVPKQKFEAKLTVE